MEPVVCYDSNGNAAWFAKLGGHVWFDVTLFVQIIVNILDRLPQEKTKKKAE
jgi:hypothetical protein